MLIRVNCRGFVLQSMARSQIARNGQHYLVELIRVMTLQQYMELIVAQTINKALRGMT